MHFCCSIIYIIYLIKAFYKINTHVFILNIITFILIFFFFYYKKLKHNDVFYYYFIFSDYVVF
jgi:hypothetical protein